MSEIDEAERTKKQCKMVVGKNKNLYCITHSQSLLYIYIKDGYIFCRCQIGEDMRPRSKLWALA